MDLREMVKAWKREVLGSSDEGGKRGHENPVTDTGVEIEPVYTPLDGPHGSEAVRAIGLPGRYPFARGIDPLMYRNVPWIKRAYSGFGDPTVCNARYRRLLECGADEIVIAVDLPTQVGYDSDHIMAKGEVGKVGVAVDTLRDMELLFENIPLDSMRRVSMLGNSFGPFALALFIALGEKQGLKPEQFVVDLQNDSIKEYVARGTYIFPIEPAVKITADVIEYCSEHMRHWYPCTVCANHINAAGAGSTVAAAFALCNAAVYIRELVKRGNHIDNVAPLFTMFVDERTDFFVTVALLRAARKVWAEVLKTRLGATSAESLALKMTAYSHGGETLLEPQNNIVRITLAALAYVFGGVHSLYNASFDEVLGTPTEDAAKIAIRTQQILTDEFGITTTSDPLGGSYFVESLTQTISEEMLSEFMEVEEMGGSLEAIRRGYIQQKINEGAIRRQREFEQGKRTVIGVNKYRIETSPPRGAFRIDPKAESRQVERLKSVRKERNQRTVDEALVYVHEAAEGGDNLVPAVLEAVRAYASVGEVCDVLRSVYGEYEGREYFTSKR